MPNLKFFQFSWISRDKDRILHSPVKSTNGGGELEDDLSEADLFDDDEAASAEPTANRAPAMSWIAPAERCFVRVSPHFVSPAKVQEAFHYQEHHAGQVSPTPDPQDPDFTPPRVSKVDLSIGKTSDSKSIEYMHSSQKG